jgi:hypothetical protein
MAVAEPRQPEQFSPGPAEHPEDFVVSELAAEYPGAMSPFGEDVEFPLPLERIRYTHPTIDDRPNLAGA